ncbi:ead/Ea22-like family protein [Lelliottia aquatilis]|uniref:ead/Ea22-like family protein n=1 Tax=Lelliottia aquatilis TaxID=2080838 RepID=UPI001FAF3F27|nr:ead/Ea22-like family protein [Lelliottia aquatilis]
MSTNKQALREAAEKATHGEWLLEYGEDGFDGDDALIQCEVQGRIPVARIEGAHPESGFDADFQQEQQANAEFIAAASPATVLALLDELEAAERRNAELKSDIKSANDRYENRTPTQWAYDQACSAIEKHRLRAEASEKRIAELEARPANPINFKENADADYCRGWAWNEVKKELASEAWTVGDNCTFYGFFCWGWDSRRQFNEQRATGITVKGDGE